MSFGDLRGRILQTRESVPTVPEGGLDRSNEDEIRDWAKQIDDIIDELEFTVVLLDAAAYEWESNRSGAASQNHGLLCGELMSAIQNLKGVAQTNILNVLVPRMQLVKDKTVVSTKDEDEETRQEYYAYKECDPSGREYSKDWVCRHAPMIREVFLATFHKLDQCIGDFLEAKKKDGQNGGNMFGY